ncbi:MAG: 1-deoxy-D-xylulose-5-phosphate synthase, partial [Gammaproteobacteria bacterium]|nr:1-deoxy-D-xylulose-5-phosphate synthase [Gammaproteobacteria bacterium]
MTISTPLLDKVNSPADLRKLPESDLETLAKELREFLLYSVSQSGGHFAAGLGTIELTIALHYIYNTPDDNLVWDVGHQAYPHKILTGRKDQMHTIRQWDGVSPFPKRAESEYDAFGVGHSSTSISAALGMAKASKLKGETDRNIVAVIGDGSMTAGLAFEGLNNAGIENSNILVILNDNHMAIDPNVGALNEYLLDITTSRTYNKVKDEVWNILGKLKKFGPNTQAFIQKIENGIKSIILKQSNLFESLNFRYFGPVDGHDVVHLTETLNDLKTI